MTRDKMARMFGELPGMVEREIKKRKSYYQDAGYKKTVWEGVENRKRRMTCADQI